MIRTVRLVLVPALLLGFAAPVTAGPISVFTEIWDVANTGHDELFMSGLGNLAVLTTGGGVSPVVTVPADQTSASSPVVGFWPIVGFRDLAQYDAQRGTVLTIPETPVRLYAEVYNGAYGMTNDVRIVYIDGFISGTFGASPGQNSLDWQFVNPSTQVTFGSTTVTLSYTPIHMPDGQPQIQFQDGTPPIGWPGSPYYPTLLQANVDVQRDPNSGDPSGGSSGGTSGSDPVGTPEPTSALLLAGLAFGGFVTRARAMGKR
jgi:hypothetical protein